VAIEGNIPSPFERPTGCPFHPRCTRFMEVICDKSMPGVTAVDDSHLVRCFLYETQAEPA
jgi:peptide/nickel transport system ATP-binding protein